MNISPCSQPEEIYTLEDIERFVELVDKHASSLVSKNPNDQYVGWRSVFEGGPDCAWCKGTADPIVEGKRLWAAILQKAHEEGNAVKENIGGRPGKGKDGGMVEEKYVNIVRFLTDGTYPAGIRNDSWRRMCSNFCLAADGVTLLHRKYNAVVLKEGEAYPFVKEFHIVFGHIRGKWMRGLVKVVFFDNMRMTIDNCPQECICNGFSGHPCYEPKAKVIVEGNVSSRKIKIIPIAVDLSSIKKFEALLENSVVVPRDICLYSFSDDEYDRLLAEILRGRGDPYTLHVDKKTILLSYKIVLKDCEALRVNTRLHELSGHLCVKNMIPLCKRLFYVKRLAACSSFVISSCSFCALKPKLAIPVEENDLDITVDVIYSGNSREILLDLNNERQKSLIEQYVKDVYASAARKGLLETKQPARATRLEGDDKRRVLRRVLDVLERLQGLTDEEEQLCDTSTECVTEFVDVAPVEDDSYIENFDPISPSETSVESEDDVEDIDEDMEEDGDEDCESSSESEVEDEDEEVDEERMEEGRRLRVLKDEVRQLEETRDRMILYYRQLQLSNFLRCIEARQEGEQEPPREGFYNAPYDPICGGQNPVVHEYVMPDEAKVHEMRKRFFPEFLLKAMEEQAHQVLHPATAPIPDNGQMAAEKVCEEAEAMEEENGEENLSAVLSNAIDML